MGLANSIDVRDARLLAVQTGRQDADSVLLVTTMATSRFRCGWHSQPIERHVQRFVG